MGTQAQPGIEPGRDGADRVLAPALAVWVLGPLRVFRDGAELDPGPPRSRTVLALLVSEIGRVVSVDRLINGIWGDEPPPTAKKAVHVHISNLRRALGEDFPLRTAPGGYLVQSAAVEVDAVRFQEGVERAMRLLRTDPSAASQLLAESLGLWQGRAYADFGDDVALVPEITRLSELRLSAVEHRIDAELRLGRHAEVVGELETLTVDHPYRERFRELQMLALYRSGRQAEALRAYEHTRTVLADELGLDPTPALRDLQHQILSQSGDLDLDEPGTETYAFLASDLEDSTAMWDSEPEPMQRALEQHDDIVGRAITGNSGRVFKHTGDGVLAVFAEFSGAVRAAATAQLDLASHDWPTSRPLRVRMAVDEGTVARRADDFFGPVMNRVNRIMASGHGGQVLAPAALTSASPVETASLGQVDYRGLGRIEVVQLVIGGLPSNFPDLRTERTVSSVERAAFGRSIRGYELRERFGEGAHGEVFRAYQASIGREVAVKVIRSEYASRTDFVRRFEAEAQFVAQLEHPHIVSLYDYWRDSDGAYLVMQLLRGGSLASSLERAPWHPPAALQLLEQVGAGLDYAHRHGVVHRDIKPSNVLLDDDGNAYLTDFGIAVDNIDAVSIPVESSAAYVSPEEMAGLRFGTPADVYGLGLLTYEILTRHRPVLGGQPGPLREHRHDLPVALDDVLARATDPDPDHRYPRIDDFLRAVRQAAGTDVVTAQRVNRDVPIRNPFKGLRAFGETDARDFFGREELTESLVESVRSQRLTTVVGPSGCGKSSLVRAGLLPAVRRGALGDRGVLITEMFPGTFPFEELEAALMSVTVRGQEGILAELAGDDRGLVRVSKQILPDDDSELLLVIDQFEELFSLTTDEAARRRFLANLTAAVGDERGRVRVVVTMRADFLDRPLADPDFGTLLGRSLLPVAAPTRDELAASIARPANAAGLEFEPGLVPRIVGDVIDQPGALPLLQYALTELAAQAEGDRLTTAVYEWTGGVSGALAARAEEIYDGFAAPVRSVAREVFLRLVAVSEDADDTRRRVRRSELGSLGLAASTLDQVLDAYGSFRLLSFDCDPVTRGPTIEVAHEALIREWPRYRRWVDEERESLLLERRLDAAAVEWNDNGRDASFLLAGGRLEQVERWATEGDVRLTDDERGFLEAGRYAEDERARVASNRRRGVLAVVSVLAAFAIGLAAVAFVQRGDAERQASRAEREASRAAVAAAAADAAADAADAAAVDAREESERASAAELEAEAARDAETSARLVSDARLTAATATDVFERDPDAGLLLAVAASDLLDVAGRETPEVPSALYETAIGHRALHRFDVVRSPFLAFGAAPVGNVSSDPTGERLAVLAPSAAGGAEVRIIDTDDGTVLQTFDGLVEPLSLLWDPVADAVLVGHDGRLSSVDPETGDAVDIVTDVPGLVFVTSATADRIAYVSVPRTSTPQDTQPGTVVVIDRTTGAAIESYPGTWWVQIAPDGATAVVAPIGKFDEDIATIERFPGREPIPTTATNNVFGWTPDGELVLENKGLLQRLRLDGTVVAEASTPTVPDVPNLAAAELSPDGRWIAIEGEAGRVHVYDAVSFEPFDEIRIGEGTALYDLTWSGDSRRLVVIDTAERAVVWDLTDERRAPQVLVTGAPSIAPFWQPPDDGRLVLGWLDGHWESWSAETGGLETRGNDGVDVEFGSVVVGSGLVAAPGGLGGGVVVREVATATRSVVGRSDYNQPIGLSPDGGMVAVSRTPDLLARNGNQQRYALIDVETGAYLLAADVTGEGAFTAAFSPDGDVVAFPTWSNHGDPEDAGGVDVYATATGELLARLDVAGGAFMVAFSPDGGQLAVGGGRGAVELHDVEALLAGGDSSIGRTSLDAPTQATVGFVAGGEVIVANPAFGGDVLGWTADSEMRRLWRIGSEAVGAGPRSDGELLWLPFDGSLPTAGNDTAVGVMGLPAGRRDLADFARDKATRDLTEDECRRYFSSNCREFDELIAGTPWTPSQ